MSKIQDAELWLKSLDNINRELNFERFQAEQSLSRIAKLEEEREDIVSAITGLKNPLHRQILYMRYIEGKSWNAICNAVHYEHAHIHRLHKSAIKDVADNMETE